MRRALLAVLILAGPALQTGCVKLLEMDDPEDDAEPAGTSLGFDDVPPASLPTDQPRFDSRGPLVPNTPGLRVPAGYWTRVRIDVAEHFLPFSWAALTESTGRLTFRLQASGAVAPKGALPLPALRAIVHVALPTGGAGADLVGLGFGRDSLTDSTVSLKTTSDNNWLVTLTNLRFDDVTDTLVRGSLEGDARRGAKGRRVRKVRAAFLALRAPDAPAPPLPGPMDEPSR